MIRRPLLLLLFLIGPLSGLGSPASAGQATERVKVIVDTDLGFASDDAMAVLLLLQSPRVDLLGVTVVTGNDWLEQEVANALRLLEIAGRTDVPVYVGSERPLVNSREEMVRREALFGETSDGGYKGAWRDGGPGPREVRPPDGRLAAGKASPDAVNFLIETVRRHPGEVVVAAIGPLTNIALAVSKTPEVATLAREIVIMGGGVASQPEFNFWMDPEAARIVLRAPWRRVTLTPLEICKQAPFTRELAATAAEGDSPIARYFAQTFLERTEHPVSPLMYDQIAILSLLEPDVVARAEEMRLDVEIDHGASYGAMLHWDQNRRAPPGVGTATVLLDLDYPSFAEKFLDLMRQPTEAPDDIP